MIVAADGSSSSPRSVTHFRQHIKEAFDFTVALFLHLNNPQHMQCIKHHQTKAAFLMLNALAFVHR